MTITAEEVQSRFPIHWMVWNDQTEELCEALGEGEFTAEELEVKDPRGRTPLLLAVTLARLEAVQILLDAGADVNCEKDGWTAVQEATATGNKELLALVLERRELKRQELRAAGVPDLLRRLSLAPDFYLEMKWEFTSWVPLVSRMCPFDTYKVYKRGGNVRVDTTLIGFDNNRWQRGDRTYIFTGQGTTANLVELDHERGTWWKESLDSTHLEKTSQPCSKLAAARLKAPIAVNYLDTDKISFERNKSGIWGWRQDKTEVICGRECKVFGASNVELVSKTRTEHLPRGAAPRAAAAPLAGLLALAEPEQSETESTQDEDTPLTPSSSSMEEDPPPVSWDLYFSDTSLEHDIGRVKKITTKVQKFKATLWLCEDYPLQLQEQIMPILDLMATMSSPHFAKLKDFIHMQLPAGFPVKIEIPLFHVLNARITFGNIFASETPVPHVETITSGDKLACVLDDMCFHIPTHYRDATTVEERVFATDDEEGLLQYAIEQSLIEAGTLEEQVDVWEALRGASPASPAHPAPAPSLHLDHEERQLQRAIEASLAIARSPVEDIQGSPEDSQPSSLDPELMAALELSAKEQERRERERLEEERALDEVLRLSLVDK